MSSKDLDQLQREADAAYSLAPILQKLAVLATTPTYDNDAAAAAGGVAVGEIYRNANIVQMRIS